MATGRPIPSIDFLGVWKIAVFASVLLIGFSLYVFFSKGEEKYGVDFTGGYEFLVQVNGAEVTSDAIRTVLSEKGVENAIVQAFERGSPQYLVRLEGGSSDVEPLKVKITDALKAKYQDTQILRVDYVGPAVGAELKSKALIALSIALLGMLAFISFRFEFAFALGAVVALFHDVIFCIGVYLLTGHTYSMGTLAAALTIVGYSVNDTIVIFDRIREEIHKSQKFNLIEVMNRCINMMLSRTLITHLLTFFAALTLYLFGGGAIADLSLFLLAGILAGSYSTIYIACPVVIAWHRFRGGAIEHGA